MPMPMRGTTGSNYCARPTTAGANTLPTMDAIPLAGLLHPQIAPTQCKVHFAVYNGATGIRSRC